MHPLASAPPPATAARRPSWHSRTEGAHLATSLGLIYLLGIQLFDRWTASLALFFLAAVPAAVQLAHFATVDTLFAFLCLAFFCLLPSALRTGGWPRYALAGLLVGMAGATRLNGLLLGGVLLAGHLLQVRTWRGLHAARLWGAGLAALAALLLLQPYLVADPFRLWRAESTDDLGFSLEIARGGILRLWTLVDVHTLPYLHYWTHLLLQAAGWPLVVGAPRRPGIRPVAAAAGPSPAPRLDVPYFVQIGGLHTKHYPSLLGIEFQDDRAEPSFIGYDHPAVIVLQRRSPQAVQQGLDALADAPHCPDALLRQAADALRRDDLALRHLTRAVRLDSSLTSQLAPWIQAVRTARDSVRQED